MRMVLTGATLALFLTSAFAQAQESPAKAGKIAVELNKLEAAGRACRAYFVVDNATETSLAELELDVFIFSKEGVILQGTVLPFADVPAGRPSVALFEFADVPCVDIGRLIVNKVLACTPSPSGGAPGCAHLVETSTRAGVAFE